MKSIIKCMAFLVAVTAMFSGCDSKKPEESTSSQMESTTTIEETTTTTVETTTEFTEIITEPISEISSENNSDYRTVLDSYHQAYIDGNADAVYALFNPNEITAFDNYMKVHLKDNLGESETTVEKMFTKDNIVSAINSSIQNIHTIMSNYNTGGSDTWTISIDETTIERYTAEELSEINSKLNINVTDGYSCEIPFYKNTANDEIFVAEPSSILQIDGKWYVSYSVACDRLIEFMDIEF